MEANSDCEFAELSGIMRARMVDVDPCRTSQCMDLRYTEPAKFISLHPVTKAATNMIKLLFKWVVPLVLLLAAGLVGYNYFLGTPDEKEQSQQIISKFKDLGKDVIGLLKSEKGKYDAGKYDTAMNKISAGIAALKEKASSASGKVGNWNEQIKDLETKKAALESQIAKLGSGTQPDASGISPGQNGFGQPNTAPQAFSIEQLNSQIEALATQTQQLGMSIGQ